MRSQGIEESKIPAYRSGIDLEQRVTIETINKGKIAYQNQSPGNWQGNWYSLDESTPATKLGINPEGQVRDTGLIVPKEVKAYQAQQKLRCFEVVPHQPWTLVCTRQTFPDRRRWDTMVYH